MAVFVAITIVVLAAHDIPLAGHLRTVERDRLVTGLERDAFVIAGRAEELLESGSGRGDAGLQQIIDAYRSDTGARVVITDRTGIAIAISDEEVAAGTDYSTRPEIASALAGTPTTGERFSATLGFPLLYVAVPVLSGDSVVGTVRLTYPAAEVGSRVTTRVRGLLVVALISVVIAAGAAAVLAGTFTRPIRRLRSATDRLAAGELTVTAPTDEGPPEIRGLADAFNSMSTRIQRLVDEQRAFAGDASHQLRTPLTALRLRLDQAADMVDTDPAGARSRLESASAETERLQHLVDGLLALARADGRTGVTESVDVAALARERVEVWSSLAEEHGVDLTVQAPDRAMAMAVDGAVEQVIDNFIDNALAVTPAGGRIDVAVEVEPAGVAAATGRHVVLHVRDTGPGMTDEQLARAFDRFWRAPGSPATGSGLGLAIVAQLAAASGAVATISRRASGGIDAAAAFRSAELDPPRVSVNRRITEGPTP
ncbi:MAG: ATP-binding protein [Ilumatobacteraceae bacterium]